MPSKFSQQRAPRLLITAVSLASATLFACAAQAGPGFDPQRIVATPSSELKFENINPAIRMATAWGDKGKGAHGTFGRFPASFITPDHSHSGAYHGIVVKGVMTNPFEGEKNPPKLGPGAYWYVPAEVVHATACVSETPCEFYFHAASAFDFHPVE